VPNAEPAGLNAESWQLKTLSYLKSCESLGTYVGIKPTSVAGLELVQNVVTEWERTLHLGQAAWALVVVAITVILVVVTMRDSTRSWRGAASKVAMFMRLSVAALPIFSHQKCGRTKKWGSWDMGES
jgi:hypothetical protein